MTRLLVFGTLACAIAIGAGAASARENRPPVPRLIVFSRDGSLWTIRPDGSRVQRLLARDRQHANRPALSPDRKLVLFDGTPAGEEPFSDFDIHAIRPDGTGLRRSLTSSRDWELDAQWMPNGRISYTRMPPGGSFRQAWIWTMRPDGSDAKRLVRGIDAHWSPDGRRVLFARHTPKSDLDLFVANADGTLQRQLTRTRVVDGPAGWSPDGRKILFSRSRVLSPSEDSPYDIFVMNRDGSEVRKLRAGVACCWSPDGRILYTSPKRHLMVMSPTGRGARRIGRVVRVYDPDWR